MTSPVRSQWRANRHRAVATRYDKLTVRYHAAVMIAVINGRIKLLKRT
jgi:hypothetical protein